MTETRDWGQSRHRERAELLGYSVETNDHGGSTGHWRPSEFMSNSQGRVHGGLVGSIIDDIAAIALRASDPKIATSSTVSMHIDYLRPLVIGADYICTGEVLRIGGRLAVADARIVDSNGQLAVRGSATFAITRFS
jgi:acyl-CoA thioesterase